MHVTCGLIALAALAGCGATSGGDRQTGKDGLTADGTATVTVPGETAKVDSSDDSHETEASSTSDGLDDSNKSLRQRLIDDKGVLGAVPRASVGIYSEKAKAGDTDAQRRLAVCYYVGTGTTENEGEARKWFKSASEANDKRAQYCLAYMLDKGEGGPADKREAFFWYQVAAEGQGGYAGLAEKEVARMSADFDQVERDRIKKEVLAWFNASNLRKTKAEKSRRSY